MRLQDESSSPSRQPLPQVRSSSRLHMMVSSQQHKQQQEQQQQKQQQLQQQQQQQQMRQRKAPEPLRRAVADCLSASHHASLPPITSEPVRTLQDYLANPSTIHFAYTVLLEHALAERDRSPPVVMKCVSLLKRYLFRYVPPITTLQQIDSFCAGLIRECTMAAGKSTNRTPCANQASPSPIVTTSVFASEALIKSLTYVRAIVSRHLPGFSLQQSASTSFKLQPVPPSPRSRLLSSHYAANGLHADEKEFARPSPALMLGLGSVEDGSDDYLAIDVLKWRWIARKGRQVWMPSPIMMDSGGIARPQVENLGCLEQGIAAFWLGNKFGLEKAGDRRNDLIVPGNQLLRASTATAIADTAAVKSHLRDVATTKRQAVSRWGGEPLTTMRKRPRPLFQYRCYSKQQPLRLSDADIEEVIAAVCAEATSPTLALAPPLSGNQSGDTANVAGSVLIKLMIDMYLADARTAAPLTISILQVMLSAGSVAVRIRAFDLVFNLGVHAHLLEPMQSDDQDGSQGVPQFPTTGSVDGNGIKHGYGTPRAVSEFELWLLSILCEMMLFLLQLEEKEEGVWAAAMSSLLYLICDRGRIIRERLERVDIRILRTLLDISRENAWADEIHCRLIRMMANMLYVLPQAGDAQDSAAILDLEKLEIIGGMEFICKEYALANKPEGKRNLFTIMFEYLVYDLRSRADSSGKKIPGQDEVQAAATALVLAGAPESLSNAFRQSLYGVGGRLSKCIMKALDRDIVNGRLNATVLEDITRSIDLLIDKHAGLDEEFRDLMSVVRTDEPQDKATHISCLETKSWAALHALLHSSRSDYRQHGYSWLNHLLATEVKCLHAKQKEEFPHRHCLFTVLDQAKIEPSDSPSAVQLFFGLLKSRRYYVRQGFLTVLEQLLAQCQRLGCDEEAGSLSNDLASSLVWLMSGSLWQFISANDTNRINVLQMCNLMLSQICIRWVPPAANKAEGDKKDHNQALSSSSSNSLNPSAGDTVMISSMAALFLKEEAAASKDLVVRMPTALFYWPLMQLAGATMDDMTLGIAVGSKGGGNVPGCASDVRAALLLLLVGKCTVQQSALEEVGGEEFFRSLLDDTDARVAYYTASFLIKRMMVEDADNYQRVLHNLVFKAQQKNDEKLLENPYLQIGGILQFDPDLRTQVSIQDDS